MSLTVGELQVLLSGDPSKLNRELDRIDNRAGKTEKVHTAAWSRIGSVAGTALKAGALLATAATIGVGAALRSTVKIGMEYQDQLNTLGAVSGATAEQMAQVAATAKTLGADLTLPATSAADAAAVMTELAKASFSVDDAQTAAKGSLQLAAAAQIEGAAAATIQANALQAFNLKASDAGRVADVLANSANASSAEITDVADALAQAGAVASAANISIEDTAATIGILANNGIRGSDAGTLLKSALLALRDTSKPAQAAMDALNLSVYDAQGNFVGLESIFGDLAEAQSTMSQEAFEAATNVLFGSDASRLAGIAAKTGAEGFDQMRDAMSRQGAAADVAAAKAKGVRGAFEGLQSQVETLKIQGFEALSPAMESVVRKASDMVPVLGQHLFGAMEKAIGAAQELREEFGPEMAELGEIAAQKWGQFVDLLGELGSAVAPSLPDLVENLIRIAQVGGEVAEAMLPALEAGLRLAGPAAGMLAGALGVVADVLETLQPILPLIVGGFMAFKAIGAVASGVRAVTAALSGASGALQVYAQNLAMASYSGGVLASSAGKASTAVSGLARAIPLLAVATAGATATFGYHNQLLDEFGDKASAAFAELDQGGSVAENAERKLAALRAAAENAPHQFLWFGNEHIDQLNEAEAEYRRITDSMTPLQEAQQNVAAATNDLDLAQDRYGESSTQARNAGAFLTTQQLILEQKQRDLAAATETATSKLLAQTQAALAGANADLALSMANTSLTTAMDTYKTSLADGTLTTTQRQQATDAMTQSALSAAQAAGAQAAAHSTATTEEGKQADADAALLASLQATAKQLGSNTPAAITNLIGSLQASAGTASTTSARMKDLGLSVVGIPNSKYVDVKAPTDKQMADLKALGLRTETLPDGTVRIYADTGPAGAALAGLVRDYEGRTIYMQARISGAATTGRPYSPSGSAGGRAAGGPVSARVPYLVGEGGREMFVPEVPGWIATARQTAEIMAAGNSRAASMLASGGARMGSAGTGSASVGGVTKQYNLNATVTHALTPREFVALQREAEALYG